MKISEQQYPGLTLSFDVKKNLFKKKNVIQAIEIFESFSHGKILMLDNKVMMTEKDEFIYHEAIAHTSLLRTKKINKILIIGGGDGGTLRECLKYKEIETIDLCEIDPDIITASRKFFSFSEKAFSNPKVNIFIEDGFKFLQQKKSKNEYDVIIVDSADPEGEAQKLFNASFYKNVKKCLKSNGIVVAQCESPFFFENAITKTEEILSKEFTHNKFFTAPVTTYPSGYWAFAIASMGEMNFNKKKYNELCQILDCKYYNEKVDFASFALPNFFLKLINKL